MRAVLPAPAPALALALALLLPGSAGAVQPDEILSDPALEARARTLSKDLRCVVCQGELIDDFERRHRPRPAPAGARAS